MDWNSNRVRAARRFCGRAAGLIAWLALVTMAGAGLSCGRPQGAEPARVVRIGYFANLTHAQAVLGVASGDYERAVAPAKLEAAAAAAKSIGVPDAAERLADLVLEIARPA